MTDKETVLAKYPNADCSGPVKLYWPGQEVRKKYIVTTSYYSSRVFGEGDTPEEAWAWAATRVREAERPGAKGAE